MSRPVIPQWPGLTHCGRFYRTLWFGMNPHYPDRPPQLWQLLDDAPTADAARTRITSSIDRATRLPHP